MGESTAVVGTSVVVLIGVPPYDELVAALWRVVAAGGGAVALLGVLAGRPLPELPDFAFMCREGDRTVLLCRGGHGVHIGLADGTSTEFTAPGVLTWAERVVQNAELVVLYDANASRAAAMLPVISGVVPAGAIECVLPGRASEAAEPTPVEPTPVEPALVEPAPVEVAPVEPAPAGVAAIELLPASVAPVEGTTDGAPAPLLRPLLRSTGPSAARPATWARPIVDRLVGGPVDPPVGDHDGRTVARATAVPSAPMVELGDHDGRTMPRLGRPSPRPSPQPPTSGLVPVITCPSGHHNRPTASSCRNCDLPLDLDQEPIDVDRLVLGVLRLPNGEQAAIDRPLIVIGREPRASRPDARLVAVQGSDQISRLHVELRVRQWTVEVYDLSENGTWVANPRQPPVRLERDRPVILSLLGEIVLADELTLRYEAGAARQ